MLRVVHFVSNAERNYVLYPLVDYADHTRFDVVIGTLSPAGVLQQDREGRGIRCFALGCTSAAHYPLAVLRLARWLQKEQIDIVLTHFFDACFVGLLAARLAMIPLAIFTGHHPHEVILQHTIRQKRLPLWIDSLASRWLAHRVIALSPSLRDLLVRWEKVPAKKIAVIPNGFDFSRLRPSEGARDRIRAELALRDDELVLGAVGRLYWVKDQMSLLHVFARIVPEVPNSKLLLVGDGPDRERLRREVMELSITERVVFTGHRSDVPDVLSAMDVFVHSSLAEAFCMVISEAAALAKPIVTTDVGGAREAVEDGVSGFIVPPGDSNALYEALLTLLRRPGEWGRMGEVGRRRVEQYSAPRMAAEYEEHYIRWLEERRGRRQLHSNSSADPRDTTP